MKTSRTEVTGGSFGLLFAGAVLLAAALAEAVFALRNWAGLVLGTLFGVPLIWLTIRGSKSILRKIDDGDLFSPWTSFPIAYVLWFGLGSLAFWFDPYPPPYSYFALGFLAYATGALVARAWTRNSGNEISATKSVPWLPARFRLIMKILILLMVCSYWLLVAQVGIPAIHADVAFRREGLDEHGRILAIFMSSSWTAIFFSAADLWSNKRSLRPLVSRGIVVVACLMVASFGNRGFLIVPVLTLLILRHYWKKRLPVSRVALAFVIILVATVAYEYVRGSELKANFGDADWSTAIYSDAAFMLYANLATFRDIVRTIPSNVPYQHGYLTFGVLAQVLPGHHESSDVFFKRILGNDFLGGGQPGSLLAPFYGDFGVVGILAGMLLFGLFSVLTYRWMRRHPTLLAVLVYSWLAQTALLSLYGALVTYFITLWMPFMWWILLRWMRAVPSGAVSSERLGAISQQPTGG